ncbi:hypothetical protein HAX54_021188 [Datura stramonium]|uniref:Uncharacterized protein n=1 Tax=Datura stramonium TaxID=4076 RepID=A0ABS8UUP6_DATST|nr:hypothetical protein [Datura stramonium]
MFKRQLTKSSHLWKLRCLYTIDRSITLHENIFKCGNYDPLLSREDNFDATLVDDVVENILHMSEVGKDFNFENTQSASKGTEGLSFILATVDCLGLDNFEQVSDDRALPASVEKSPNKFDARENVVSFASGKQDAPTQMRVFSNIEELEFELIREESPKISVDVVKGSERNEHEEENLKVAFSLTRDTSIVALKSKQRQGKNKSSANDFELDVPISSLKTRKHRKKKQLVAEKTAPTLVENTN